MSLTVLLGGARSGKSSTAEAIARGSGTPVVYIATAEASDDEMRTRIDRHRARRPHDWTTVEAPHDLAEAIAVAAPEATVLVECLSLWIFNRVEAGASDDEIVAAVDTVSAAAAARLQTIVVSNEVGLGIVPATPLGRRYRDLLGIANQRLVARASSAYLIVAGRLLPLT